MQQTAANTTHPSPRTTSRAMHVGIAHKSHCVRLKIQKACKLTSATGKRVHFWGKTKCCSKKTTSSYIQSDPPPPLVAQPTLERDYRRPDKHGLAQVEAQHATMQRHNSNQHKLT